MIMYFNISFNHFFLDPGIRSAMQHISLRADQHNAGHQVFSSEASLVLILSTPNG